MFDGVFGKTVAAFAAFGIMTGCGSPTTLLDVVVTATAAAATDLPFATFSPRSKCGLNTA